MGAEKIVSMLLKVILCMIVRKGARGCSNLEQISLVSTTTPRKLVTNILNLYAPMT
jgi:hypothetical protein